ncbi:acyl carrier protein [Methylobacterium sp. 77]|uniref:acyl carrier protein n=1 Tax=Methylobacterium sp. 77 TaxID=1101192 RepID=UPI0003AAD3B6|nr:acyl carrier protein [Methylobacterium sp. 77]
MSSSISDQVHSFVVETFLFGDVTSPLTYDGSFIEHGVIDSTGILELVAFVEDTFGIVVADDEILPANFDSIAKVDAFVARKRFAVVSPSSQAA